MTTRGYFGLGVWHPKKGVNIGTLWRSAALYDASFVFTVGRRYDHRQPGDTMQVPRHTPLIHHTDINDLVEHLPHGCPLIGVELCDGAVPLTDYTHPARACYLLGAEDHGLPASITDTCHDLVVIPSPTPWSMNVAVAGTLVMYDRYTKALARREELVAV